MFRAILKPSDHHPSIGKDMFRAIWKPSDHHPIIKKNRLKAILKPSDHENVQWITFNSGLRKTAWKIQEEWRWCKVRAWCCIYKYQKDKQFSTSNKNTNLHNFADILIIAFYLWCSDCATGTKSRTGKVILPNLNKRQ